MDLTEWKRAKKQKGMTIADIAEKANLPKGTVQNIFAGYVPSPRLDTVQAIEKALGINGEITPLNSNAFSDSEINLIYNFRKLPPESQAAVIKLVSLLSP